MNPMLRVSRTLYIKEVRTESRLSMCNGAISDGTIGVASIHRSDQLNLDTGRKLIALNVLSEVDVQTPWGIVTSVITTRSVDELQLKAGSDVLALVGDAQSQRPMTALALRGGFLLSPVATFGHGGSSAAT